MSKKDELRLHGRNRKLPSAIKLGSLTPELITHNLFIYHSLADDPMNLSGEKTAEHRHEHAVAGVSTGEQVYELGEFYNQIHTEEISLHSGFESSNHRFAMMDPGHHLEYHMDPPNTYNLLCPISDPITLKVAKSWNDVQKGKVETIDIDVGEVYFVNPSYPHASYHKSDMVRIAILANFEYTEEAYDKLTRIL